MHQGNEFIKYGTVEDWYVRYLGLNKSGFCNLGAIVEASSLIWCKRFKQNNFKCIVDVANFAVVYTPTSIEVGEVIAAKFACVHFDSSKVSFSRVPLSQLVVSLPLYGVLLMVTVLRYGRYSSLGMVEEYLHHRMYL